MEVNGDSAASVVTWKDAAEKARLLRGGVEFQQKMRIARVERRVISGRELRRSRLKTHQRVAAGHRLRSRDIPLCDNSNQQTCLLTCRQIGLRGGWQSIINTSRIGDEEIIQCIEGGANVSLGDTAEGADAVFRRHVDASRIESILCAECRHVVTPLSIPRLVSTHP